MNNNLDRLVQAVAIDAGRLAARDEFLELGKRLVAHLDAYKERPEADTKVSVVMAHLSEFFCQAFGIPQPKPVPLQKRPGKVVTRDLIWDQREREAAAKSGHEVWVHSEEQEQKQ
jgi:hypothetical protein